MDKENIDFIIVEPIELPEILDRVYTVCKPLIARNASVYVNKVLDNGSDPLKVAENLTAIKLFIKEVEDSDALNDYTITELAKHGGKVTLPGGTKVETMEGGGKYVFDNCNDPELVRLEAAAEAAAKAVKDRKEFLKKVQPEGMDTVDKETGELIRLYPPVKASVSTYKVTLSAKEPQPDTLTDDLPF